MTMVIALALLAGSQATAALPAPQAAVAAADPARLAAAEKAVAVLVPKGVYMTMMRDRMPQMMDMMMTQMMAKSPAELGLPANGQTPADRPMGESAALRDPHFKERMSIMTRVMSEEMGSVFDKIEPRVRVGLSRAFARKFLLAQLGDFNAFFATPSGAAFAHEYLLTFMDPEVMQEMMGAMPELMKAMPAIMEKTQKATAHLPEPPAPETKNGK